VEDAWLVSSLDTKGYSQSVCVSGNHAYLADCGSGLLVIDIADPFNPNPVASVVAADATQCVAVSGMHAYINDFYYGMRVLDVSDPELPSPVGGVMTYSYLYGLDVDGEYAYLAAAGNLGGLAIVPSQCEAAEAVPDEGPVKRPPALLALSPNPTAGLTTMRMFIPHEGGFRLMILDATGRRVRLLAEGSDSAGPMDVRWHGRDDRGQPAASGIYFARLTGEGFSETIRLALLR
jgi:hypothetical protein